MYVLFLIFGIEGRMWDVIVLIPDHCLSVYSGYFGVTESVLLQ